MDNKISSYFAADVFHDEAMRQLLPEAIYHNVHAAIKDGRGVEEGIAEQLAAAMKTWAIGKGATHYTRWFYPITGNASEKHRTFFIAKAGKALESFKGDVLVKHKPDALALASGSSRSVFEARGLISWDISSPPFIINVGTGRTLCIPATFTDYSGQALDSKTPLLKSQAYLSKAAVAVGQYFDRNINKVTPMLGCEQEFYVIDEAAYQARPDLQATHRTLFGTPYKDSQTNVHYFGAIPDRVHNFLLEVEKEAHLLGIPIHTRHNEMGIGQFEVVASFEVVNVAIDHNQLFTDLMCRTAERHDLRVLLHEKPFSGMSGSAKHNNWSLYTNTGKNLLAPAETPRKNLLFLTFLTNALNAIRTHAPLLYASLASAGNEHRLDTNGTPPAMVAVYIGQQLEIVLDDIEKLGDEWMNNEERKQALKQDIHNKIPNLLTGNTDQNRTAPIAYTGSKLEIRLAGASQNTAATMTVLNTIIADQLIAFKGQVEQLIKKKNLKKDGALLQALRQLVKDSKPIILRHKRVTENWEKEVETRTKTISQNMPEALDAYLTKAAKAVLQPILNKEELQTRNDIALQQYTSQYRLEAETLTRLCSSQIIPAVVQYQNVLLLNIKQMKDLGLKATQYAVQLDIVQRSTAYLAALQNGMTQMEAALEQISSLLTSREKAIACHQNIKPELLKMEEHINALEACVDKQIWPFASYGACFL